MLVQCLVQPRKEINFYEGEGSGMRKSGEMFGFKRGGDKNGQNFNSFVFGLRRGEF